MSDLTMHELNIDALAYIPQQIKSLKAQSLKHIRPHIYVNDAPSGSLRVDIYDEANAVQLATSNTIAISTLKTDTYAHGYYRFDIVYGLQKDVKYTIRLVGVSGYTYSASDFVGWCQDFDLRKYTATSTATGNLGWDSPFDMEIWYSNDQVRGL